MAILFDRRFAFLLFAALLFVGLRIRSLRCVWCGQRLFEKEVDFGVFEARVAAPWALVSGKCPHCGEKS